MTPDQSGRHHARAAADYCLPIGIIRTAYTSPSRIMPRYRQPPATATGGRRFGLSAAHRSGAAPIGDFRRNLPGFASARRHPRPDERPPMSSQSRPSRSPARLDPWTLAALLSTPRPLPPAPLFPRCADALRSEAAICGRTGASVPACGLRWRSTCADAHGSRLFPRTLSHQSGDSNRGHAAPASGLEGFAHQFCRFSPFFRPRRRPFFLWGARRSHRGSSSAASAAGNLHPDFAPPARQPRQPRHCGARLGSG